MAKQSPNGQMPDQYEHVEQVAREVVDQHPHFRGRARRFEFIYREGVMTVRGCVPSYYLKQVMQTLIRDIEGVRWVDNEITVTSGEGLGSVQIAES